MSGYERPADKNHSRGVVPELAGTLVRILFSLLFGGIIVLLLVSSSRDHALKSAYGLPNGWLLAMGLLAAALLYLLLRILSAFIARRNAGLSRGRLSQWPVLMATLLIFCIQAVIAVNIMFKTGWDAGAVFDFAYRKVDNQVTQSYSNYFSWYPNNLFLAWVYIQIFRLYQMTLQSFSYAGYLYTLIMFNCVLSGISAILVYRCVCLLTGRALFGWMAWCAHAALVGLSPWFLIPYSDAVGILFPILALYLYIRPQKREPLRWALIGACLYVGFRIKPSAAIVFIAMMGIESAAILSRQTAWRKSALCAAALALTVLLAQGIHTMLIVPSLGLALDKEMALGPAHFVKMGLNEGSDGVYDEEDVMHSKSFKTIGERDAANMEAIRARLKAFGFFGYVDFLTRKALVNFNSGSFAWAAEGSFYLALFNRNTPFASRLMSYYYSYGERHHEFLLFSQALWLAVLCGAFLFSFKRRFQTGREQKQAAVIRLSLAGLVIYVMLFEARARYLYTFLPLFIMAAVLGFREIGQAAGRFMLKRKNRVLPG